MAIDCIDKIRVPDEERVLFPPPNTEEWVEDAPQFDEEGRRFRVVFRPNQFCNQYLMVAEAEQDEDEDPAASKDAEQKITELKQ